MPSEAALRALREQRGEIAARIGEHLYRMIMGGLLHDPAVIAACRPLYEMEQQILRMEAALGTSGAGAAPLTQTALPVAPAPPPPPAVQDRDEMATAVSPGQRPAWQSGSPTNALSGDRADASAARVHHAHGAGADRMCAHCHVPLKATDRTCPVCGHDTADAVPLSVAAPAQASPTATHCCLRCGTSLRPHDQTCPVCGVALTR